MYFHIYILYELDINRYSVIAEGLFIITFEKLPCFTHKKREKKQNKSKCIVHLLQQLQRTAC